MEFPDINPIALSIGPFDIHWYALSYIVGLFGCIYYAQKLSDKHSLSIKRADYDHLFTYIIIGVILGGRSMYVIIYDPMKYINNPIEVFQTYRGGMSFHGGFMGFVSACYIYCKRNNANFLELMDISAIVAPFAIFCGRIGNFINGELYGRTTDAKWGMIFPNSDGETRHPSQIYEALLEGLLLLLIMKFVSRKIHIRGYNIGAFVSFYAIFRIICEFFREPDFHIGFIFGSITMGQILSIPMLLLGIYFYSNSPWKSEK
jgi:phosphatidylglycerol:prolipoprotein diacylglycerol transferase